MRSIRSLLLLLLVIPATATEIKWIPSEEPKPLSREERQQLTQLEKAILQSPNPQETLVKVAQSNNMDPNQLAELLMQNRQLNSVSLVTKIYNSLASLAILFAQFARQRPRLTSIGLSLIVMSSYLAHQIPRTGVLINNSSLFQPPIEYIKNTHLPWVAEQYNSNNLQVPNTLYAFEKNLMFNYDSIDEPTWVAKDQLKDMTSRKKSCNLQQAAVYATTIERHDIIKTSSGSKVLPSNDNDNDDHDSDIDDIIIGQAASILWEQAKQCIKTRQMSTDTTRVVVNDEITNMIMLVAKGMGVFGRYGLLPLQVIKSPDTDSPLQLTLLLSTLPSFKGSWSGNILVQIQRPALSNSSETEDNDKDEKPLLLVKVGLFVPQDGKKIGKSTALAIVNDLGQGLADAVLKYTLQSLARRNQASRYASRMHSSVIERRNTRSAKEREMEEMAADRRRRWQRKNPNAGSYRPSGDRMKSPNNAVY